MNLLEAIAFVLGVINVALVVRRSIWNYPFALAMVSLYAVIFFRTKLYSDALLQIFFVVVNVYGWVSWARAKVKAGAVIVETLPARARTGWAIGCVVATGLWGAGMYAFTDASYPWWDAGIAITSIAAQIMLARRKLENWVLWIAVDVASIALYAAKGLHLTMVLYMVFLVLAIWGLIDWRGTRRRQGFAPA